MAHVRWLAALLLPLAGMAEARAQLVIGNPYGYSVASYSRGIGFHHHRRHLTISGFVGSSYALGAYGPVFVGPAYAPFYSPYNVAVPSVNIFIQPPPVVAERMRRTDPEDDIRGVDLDEIDPLTLKPRKHPDRPALVQRPPEKKAPPAVPPPVLPPPPDEDPDVRVPDPVERGKRAFAAQHYGLAAQRFRQAVQADPREPRPHFLLAQAQFALGKYWDAVKAIRAGMDLKRDWPTAKFPPRELYKGNELDFLGHLKRLEDAIDKDPRDGVLLFLLAYELWFDGKRPKARPIFRKARPFAPDPRYIDRFLRVP